MKKAFGEPSKKRWTKINEAFKIHLNSPIPMSAIITGIALLALGPVFYFLGEPGHRSFTSFIPSAFGLIILLCGIVAQKQSLRKAAMHAAVARIRNRRRSGRHRARSAQMGRIVRRHAHRRAIGRDFDAPDVRDLRGFRRHLHRSLHRDAKDVSKGQGTSGKGNAARRRSAVLPLRLLLATVHHCSPVLSLVPCHLSL